MNGPGPAPGSLAEEARRLVEALSEWGRSHAGPLADAARAYAGPLADQVRREAGSAPGHFSDWLPGAGAPGQAAPECRYCPICQLIALLRGDRPEAAAGLVAAGTAFAEALRSVLVPPPGEQAEPPPATVQHIHVD
ncbi:MAG: hypothetical protein H0T66_10265 [Geodermatophilaceae bacterium]|nr:hypothetical protein [Geodermatophilaceae bacterium]